MTSGPRSCPCPAASRAVKSCLGPLDEVLRGHLVEPGVGDVSQPADCRSRDPGPPHSDLVVLQIPAHDRPRPRARGRAPLVGLEASRSCGLAGRGIFASMPAISLSNGSTNCLDAVVSSVLSRRSMSMPASASGLSGLRGVLVGVRRDLAALAAAVAACPGASCSRARGATSPSTYLVVVVAFGFLTPVDAGQRTRHRRAGLAAAAKRSPWKTS